MSERASLEQAPGQDADAAADVLYALGNPFVQQLLRWHRPWTVDRFLAWLEQTLRQELLGSSPDHPIGWLGCPQSVLVSARGPVSPHTVPAICRRIDRLDGGAVATALDVELTRGHVWIPAIT